MESWETAAVKKEYLFMLDRLVEKCLREKAEVASGAEPNHISQLSLMLMTVANVQQRLRDCQLNDRQRAEASGPSAPQHGGES